KSPPLYPSHLSAAIRPFGPWKRRLCAHRKHERRDASRKMFETIFRPFVESTSPDWASANLRLSSSYVKSSPMTSLADISLSLGEELEKASRESKARAVSVALLDFESGFRFSIAGDRWFHAASTIKVALLLAVLRAADEGRLRLEDPLHVRNRFISAADGFSFRVDSDADAMPELYRAIGRTVKICDLAEGMIAASSNLATNLLLDLV